MKRILLLFLFSMLAAFSLSAQTNLTVDIDDPVYLLIEMAEVKGILTRVSQVRPFPATQVKRYLEEISKERRRLSRRQVEVLDEQRRRFGLILEEPKKWWENGRVEFGGEGTDMENFPIDLRFQFNNITNAELNAGAFQNVFIAALALEGDMSSHFSYAFDIGFGASYLNPNAFAPFSHTTYNDGFALGLDSGLNNSQDYNGFAVTFHFMPEMQAQFWDDRVRIGMGRYARSMGSGSGGLVLSDEARPYDAFEIQARPAKWLNFFFSVGSLGNWFSQRAWLSDVKTDFPDADIYEETSIDEKNLTLQVLEIMPLDWLYLNLTTGSVWGKRSEISYYNPLMPLLFAQNLYGDADNISMELSAAFPLPFGVKLYGSFFADEVQFNNLGTLFSNTSQQFGFQAGLKGLIPGLGFTMGTMQYTRLEPYVYTHYEQVYPSSSALVNTNWTNDRYNLGYPLPPNSDEFMFQLESMPIGGLKVYGKYRYIRHGYGDWNNDGEIEGTVDSGGAFRDDTVADDDRHAYQDRPKDFLNDGPYEQIHMATLGGEYQFSDAPFKVSLEYTFSFANNDGTQESRVSIPGYSTTEVNSYSLYTPYSGMSNAVSLFVTIYPEY